MKKTCLNQNWTLKTEQQNSSVDFPFDALTLFSRNFEFGESSQSFYMPTQVVFTKTLPAIKKGKRAFLEFNGLNGFCEVVVNDIVVARGESCFLSVNITKYIKFMAANRVELRIASMPFKGKYTGLGIAGEINLVEQEGDAYISNRGVFVVTEDLAEKAALKVLAEINNESDKMESYFLTAALFNAKKKRVSFKIKKIKIKARTAKTFEFPIKLVRHFDYSEFDPYKYNCVVSLIKDEKVLDTESTDFGIAHRKLTARGIVINGKVKKLKGCVVSNDAGLLGNIASASTEKRKFSAVKEIGYSAVRIIGCPQESTLRELDSLGICAVVDIFDAWVQGGSLLGKAVDFSATYVSEVENAVKRLRNHPCVAMYSLGNDVPETYLRGKGYFKEITALIKKLDGTRPITVNASEIVPIKSEVEDAGGRMSRFGEENYERELISFGREKNLFSGFTEKVFKEVDVKGLSYLYPQFSESKEFVVGLKEKHSKAFEAFEETDKLPNVLGDFIFTGTDMLIGNKETKKKWTDESDIDITGKRTPLSYYKQIILGARSASYICVVDPDEAQVSGELIKSKALWNWPRYIGQNMTVTVYTGGDIVALYLDGKLIGRKLAGKVNRYVAVFTVPYYPGKLEAVSFHRGHECSRAGLETVSSPRAIKLDCSAKTLDLNKSELCYVDISIADKEGRLVPFAARNVTVAVEGGEVVALASANPVHSLSASVMETSVFEGKALCVVKAKAEGKMTVKVTSEGLLSNKITIKVIKKEI